MDFTETGAGTDTGPNPKASVEALFPRTVDCGFGVRVYPLSLAHYAILEKMGSYLVLGGHKPDALEVVRTYYVVTHPAREVIADFDDLDELAFEWAEALPPAINERIAQAVIAQVDAMRRVVPAGDKKKAGATAT